MNSLYSIFYLTLLKLIQCFRHRNILHCMKKYLQCQSILDTLTDSRRINRSFNTLLVIPQSRGSLEGSDIKNPKYRLVWNISSKNVGVWYIWWSWGVKMYPRIKYGHKSIPKELNDRRGYEKLSRLSRKMNSKLYPSAVQFI